MATTPTRRSTEWRGRAARRPFTVLSILLLALGLGADPACAQSAPSPPEGLPASGAAYRTGKSMFFGLRKVEVVGVTPTVGVVLEPDSQPGTYRVVVTIGATEFDSDEAGRDEWVAETLGGPEGAPLRFTSRAVQPEELSALLAGRSLDLPGMLLLPEGPRELTFSISAYALPARDGEGTERFLEGWTRTTFDALGIEVPRVGPGGVIASPGDDLELWLRVPVAQVRDLLPSDSPSE